MRDESTAQNSYPLTRIGSQHLTKKVDRRCREARGRTGDVVLPRRAQRCFDRGAVGRRCRKAQGTGLRCRDMLQAVTGAVVDKGAIELVLADIAGAAERLDPLDPGDGL